MLFVPLLAHAQADPVGGVLGLRAPVLDPPGAYHQSSPRVTAAPEGGWAVFWQSLYVASAENPPIRSRLVTRQISRSGVASPLTVVDEVPSLDGPDGEIFARLIESAGGSVWQVGWTSLLPDGSLARTREIDAVDSSLGPLAEHGLDQPSDFATTCPLLLPLEDGGKLVAWSGRSLEPLQTWIEVQAYDAAGLPQGPRFRFAIQDHDSPPSSLRCPQGTVLRNGGRLVAWSSGDGQALGLSEFLPNGDLTFELGTLDRGIGPPFLVASRPSGRRFYSVIGAATDVDPPRLRRYEIDEFGIGSITAEAPVGAPRGSVLTEIQADQHGNVVALWQTPGNRDLSFARLWNQDLVAQGGSFVLPGRHATAGFGGSPGDLLAAWVSPLQAQAPGYSAEPVRAQRYRVRRDDDRCTFRRNLFSCDTGNDGGAFEVQLRLAVGLRAGDQPLLADVDNDGREDACIFRGDSPDTAPVLLCDPEHDGGPGLSIPLPFGVSPGIKLLLGHLNRDGRTDFCLVGGGHWNCLRPSGVSFGRLHWQPLLADFDGDGVDNFCEYYQGRFACDTGNDGGVADLRLSLPNSALPGPNAVGLAGDLDGDGRDEACVWAAGRLVCGYHAGTGGPVQRIERHALGAVGDTPLLGNLDAF